MRGGSKSHSNQKSDHGNYPVSGSGPGPLKKARFVSGHSEQHHAAAKGEEDREPDDLDHDGNNKPSRDLLEPTVAVGIDHPVGAGIILGVFDPLTDIEPGPSEHQTEEDESCRQDHEEDGADQGMDPGGPAAGPEKNETNDGVRNKDIAVPDEVSMKKPHTEEEAEAAQVASGDREISGISFFRGKENPGAEQEREKRNEFPDGENRDQVPEPMLGRIDVPRREEMILHEGEVENVDWNQAAEGDSSDDVKSLDSIGRWFRCLGHVPVGCNFWTLWRIERFFHPVFVRLPESHGITNQLTDCNGESHLFL